ncbi:TetR/AcrR family transcriptional regulator [Rhodoglobus sp. NPDC076762]
MTPSTTLSTAELRRPLVAAAALSEFAREGFHGTTIADVAREAHISPAYVFKLFPGKEALFVAALEACFDEVIAALSRGADAAPNQTPVGVLDGMAGAYAQLIGDRRLLSIQVHAQSITHIPEVGAGLRAGLARVTSFAKDRSNGSDADVQRFMAYGQLCHLIVTAGVEGETRPWAGILTHGIRHP